MAKFESMSCPQCGGSDFRQIAEGKIVCRYCGSISILSEDKNYLVIKGWKCPSCEYINDTKSNYCGKCGARITKHCPKCGNDIQHYVKYCTNCSYEFLPGEITIYECIGGVSGFLFLNRITLTNKRLCCLANSRFESGYYEILLTDIGKLKIKGKTKMILKDNKFNNKVKFYFNVPSELPDKLAEQLNSL